MKERLAGLWRKYRSLRPVWQVLIAGVFNFVLAAVSAGSQKPKTDKASDVKATTATTVRAAWQGIGRRAPLQLHRTSHSALGVS